MQTHTGFAEVNGTRLYYEVAGSGQPLVLIHGFSLDTRMWGDQFETFARHYQVVRYDLRGFGQSAVPSNEPYTHADDLNNLLHYLKIDSVHLVGLSLGGGVAI
ncbi:MAG: alpha/beta hydrolase, partial [Chloroflexota bacterium]